MGKGWILSAPAIVAVALSGCGDGGVHFFAINDSPQAMVVKFSLNGQSTYAAYELPAKSSGDTLVSLGPTKWTGTMRILDTGCHVVWETKVAAGSGGVLISSDGNVSWVSAGPRWPKEEEPPPVLLPTTRCDVSPLP